MIRSAKMKASTPPKLMPPFQSTAASGTFPIEQTKLSIATSGPISGPQNFASVGWSLEEEALPERVGHPGRERAGDQQAAEDVAPDGGPVHDEVVRRRGEALRRAEAPPPVPSPPADMSISAWPSIEPTRPLSASRARLVDEPPLQEAAEERAPIRTIISGPPTNSPSDELPAEQDRDDDPELDHEVRGGELERHRGGEVGALAEQRAGERDRGVGAATRRRRRGRSRRRACAASRRAAAGASPASRRPPARPPRARSRGSAPRGPPRSSRTRTRARRQISCAMSTASISACGRSGAPPRAARRSWSRPRPRPRTRARRRRSGHVVVEDLQRDALERRRRPRRLGEDVDAVALLVDHPLDPADLALDPVEPLTRASLPSWYPCSMATPYPGGVSGARNATGGHHAWPSLEACARRP